MSSRAVLTALFAAFVGCYFDPRPIAPLNFGDASVIADASGAVTPTALGALDGVWRVDDGAATFGPDVLLRTSPRYQSFFTDRDGAAYLVTTAACVGGARVVLEGQWTTRTTLPQGLVRFELGPPEAAAAVCAGMRPNGPFTLTGVFGNARAVPTNRVQLAWLRAPRATEGRFLVGAHHGRCQTSDGCGASENTVESIVQSEGYGAELVEIDVNVTRDGVPVLYHDATLNPRLARGIFCHGDLHDFTFAQLRTLCRALYNEPIPSLDETLTAVVERSNLRAVWLDMKSPETIAATVPVVRRAQGLAAARGRTVTIFLGLPDDESIEAFLALPEAMRVPCLVEVDPRDLRPTGCAHWGPRWTRGPLPLGVTAAQSRGFRVMPWTIDDAEFMDVFLTATPPNGILTDFPGLAWRRFDAVGRAPQGPTWP